MTNSNVMHGAAKWLLLRRDAVEKQSYILKTSSTVIFLSIQCTFFFAIHDIIEV